MDHNKVAKGFKAWWDLLIFAWPRTEEQIAEFREAFMLFSEDANEMTEEEIQELRDWKDETWHI